MQVARPTAAAPRRNAPPCPLPPARPQVPPAPGPAAPGQPGVDGPVCGAHRPSAQDGEPAGHPGRAAQGRQAGWRRATRRACLLDGCGACRVGAKGGEPAGRAGRAAQGMVRGGIAFPPRLRGCGSAPCAAPAAHGRPAHMHPCISGRPLPQRAPALIIPPDAEARSGHGGAGRAGGARRRRRRCAGDVRGAAAQPVDRQGMGRAQPAGGACAAAQRPGAWLWGVAAPPPVGLQTPWLHGAAWRCCCAAAREHW